MAFFLICRALLVGNGTKITVSYDLNHKFGLSYKIILTKIRYKMKKLFVFFSFISLVLACGGGKTSEADKGANP
jgi:hypothetical protein